jgi:hypothetical protein
LVPTAVAEPQRAAAARAWKSQEPAVRLTARTGPRAAARSAPSEGALREGPGRVPTYAGQERVRERHAEQRPVRQARHVEPRRARRLSWPVAPQRRRAVWPAWIASVRSSRDRHQGGTLSSNSHVALKETRAHGVEFHDVASRHVATRRGSSVRSMLNLRSRCSSGIHSWITLRRTGTPFGSRCGASQSSSASCVTPPARRQSRSARRGGSPCRSSRPAQ